LTVPLVLQVPLAFTANSPPLMLTGAGASMPLTVMVSDSGDGVQGDAGLIGEAKGAGVTSAACRSPASAAAKIGGGIGR